MNCPKCFASSRVVKRHDAEPDSQERKRECLSETCAHRWTTREVDLDHYKLIFPEEVRKAVWKR